MAKSKQEREEEAITALSEEIGDKTHDRVVVIMTFGFLESVVKERLRARLLDVGGIGDGLFKGTMPLATIFACTHVAYAMGMFGPVTFTELQALAEIRNNFAHDVVHKKTGDRIDFKNVDIVDKCEKLNLTNQYSIAGYSQTNPRHRYILSCLGIVMALWQEDFHLAPQPYVLP